MGLPSCIRLSPSHRRGCINDVAGRVALQVGEVGGGNVNGVFNVASRWIVLPTPSSATPPPGTR